MIPGIATQKRLKGSKIKKEQSGSANPIQFSGSFLEIEADRSLPEFCGLRFFQSYTLMDLYDLLRSSPISDRDQKRSGQDRTSHKLIEQD